MRNVLKRILVGVLISLCVMFLKTNVFALDVQPDSAFGININGGSSQSTSVFSVTINNNQYYGFTLTQGFYVYSRFVYSNIDTGFDKKGSMKFYMLTQAKVTNVVIQTSGENYSCNFSSDGDGAFHYTNVTCDNIPLRRNFSFIIKVDFLQQNSGGSYPLRISRDIQFSSSIENTVEDIQNTITSPTTPDDSGDKYNNYKDKLANNGVITNLVTMPLTLFSSILNNINGTCNRFDLGTLLGTKIYFDCINLSDYLGTSFINTIDIIISGMFVWFISKKMVQVFEHFSSLKEGDVIG